MKISYRTSCTCVKIAAGVSQYLQNGVLDRIFIFPLSHDIVDLTSLMDTTGETLHAVWPLLRCVIQINFNQQKAHVPTRIYYILGTLSRN